MEIFSHRIFLSPQTLRQLTATFGGSKTTRMFVRKCVRVVSMSPVEVSSHGSHVLLVRVQRIRVVFLVACLSGRPKDQEILPLHQSCEVW